ncbi:phage capsid family protein [Leptospira santarosai]|uniref:phage major capsid protein n=1 Tax=Leptospira santarosai TaxID=28183 RepID=UPI0002BD75EE|nr:phage capsid family protein [Leptospira santarosai]EMO84323.1 phage capsid family protein [Leptospira santarosai str. AIM]
MSVLKKKRKLRFKPSDIKKLSLEKDMYKELDSNQCAVPLSKIIERLEEKSGFDPFDQKSDVGLMNPVDRQLLINGVDVFNSATLVDDFFKTNNSKILFPAFISDQIYLGMGLGQMELSVEDLKASSQKISSTAIEKIGIDFEKEDVDAAIVGQGGSFPSATIELKTGAVSMKKVGRKMVISYEAARRVNIDILKIYLQRIGYRLGQQMAQEGLRVLVEGDETNGSAISTSYTKTNEWKYADVIRLIFGNFKKGQTATTVVLNNEFLLNILTDETNFKQFQSLNIAEKFITSGEIQGFFGRAWKTSEYVPDNTMIAFDKTSCLSYFEEAKSSLIETDKIIDKQLEQTVISLNFGFTKLYQSACFQKTLKTTP